MRADVTLPNLSVVVFFDLAGKFIPLADYRILLLINNINKFYILKSTVGATHHLSRRYFWISEWIYDTVRQSGR
jgi:hypothetical protein